MTILRDNIVYGKSDPFNMEQWSKNNFKEERMHNIIKNIKNKGIDNFDYQLIYTDNEINNIIKICKEVPLERVMIGDASEKNDLFVGRFMNDIAGQKPFLVNNELANSIMNILLNNKSKKNFSNLFKDNYIIRRVQLNSMRKNSFIGLHLDTDSNPDYDYNVIINLSCNYESGIFTYYINNIPYSIRPKKNSITISRCDILHEVKKVESGERITLVFFLSKNTGINQSKKQKANYANAE